MAKALILFFVRLPEPGKVKTRLARAIGDQEAAGLYACFVKDMLRTIRSTGLEAWVFFLPGDKGAEARAWLGPEWKLFAQQGRDLGERMQNAFLAAFDYGAEKALLAGSDIPDMPASCFSDAGVALERHAAVLVPARDGGYCLVGFSRHGFVPRIFSGLAWGGPGVFEETLAILKNQGVCPKVLEPWEDVDTLEGLARLNMRLQLRKDLAPATREYLRKIMG